MLSQYQKVNGAVCQVSSYLFSYQLTQPVSSGLKYFQACTAFTKNRYLHAVCSTGMLCAVIDRRV
jgi:hypothetical protein